MLGRPLTGYRQSNSAPATESLMGAASDATAGVASAVNDTTRELGSTLGVAIGSVFASLYRIHLAAANTDGIPAQALAAAHDSVGATLTAATRLAQHGAGPAATRLHAITSTGFFDGLQAGCLVAAAVCATGAAGVLLALRPETAAPTARRLSLKT